MIAVELVYEKSCPHVQAARKRLIEAFQVAGLEPFWSEWEVSDPRAPAHVKTYGSPTILVDGKDIAGVPVEEAGNCCRIYATEGTNRGVPPLDMIAAALTARGNDVTAVKSNRLKAVRLNAAMLPSIGAALLPKLTCPACWPAYAGLLGSLGIGFLDYTPYLLPLTGTFLAVSVMALAYRAPTRRGYGPFLLGAVSAAAVLIGKFGYDNDPAMWIALGALVAASAWNTWPERRVNDEEGSATCPACARAEG